MEIIRRRRRRSTQVGHVSQKTINGELVWIGNYSEYPLDPETGEPRRVHRILDAPLGKVARMSEATAQRECARQVEAKLGQGSTRERDGRTSFRWFAENVYLKTEGPRWSPHTLNTKRSDLANYIYPFLGGLSLDQITRPILQDKFLNQLGVEGRNLSEDVVKRAKTLVSTILDDSVERGYIIGNPAASKKYKLPRTKPRNRQTAMLEDIGRLIAAITDERDLVIMKLAAAGAGPAEIFSMEIGSLHLDDTTLELTIDDYIEITGSAYHGKLIRGKTKTEDRTRKAWVDSSRMKAALLRMKYDRPDAKPDELLFPSRDEGKTLWSGTFLQKRIHPIRKTLSIQTPITFRLLRRSFLTWTEDLRAEQLKIQQRVAGHKEGSEVTRRRYIQPEDRKAAALVREYAELCEQEARNFELRQEKKRITREQLDAYTINQHKELSERVQ